MTSYTRDIVTDFNVPTNGTSCNTKWADIYTWLQTLSAGDVVTLNNSGGAITYNFPSSSNYYLFNGLLGGLTVTFNAAGATFSDGGGSGYFFAGLGFPDDNAYASRIASVSAGATSITLLTTGEHTRGQVGQYINISGNDLQGGGSSPPNSAFNTYRKITAKNAGLGTFSFAEPLEDALLSTWPLYDAGSGGQPDQGGPSTVYFMPLTWDLDLTINDLSIDQAGQTYCKCRKATFNGGDASGSGLVPTANAEMPWIDFDQPDNEIEVDKMVSSLTILRGTIESLKHQSMCPQTLTVTDADITTYNGTPRRLIHTGGSIGSLQIGPVVYGRTESVYVSNCVVSAVSGIQATEDDDVATRYTISNGIISSLDATNGPVRWAIPGTNMLFRGHYNFQGYPFRVLAVTQDSGYTRIQTTLYGVSAWPTMPLDTGGILDLVVHPCPNFTMRNCTGCRDAVDLSGAPANRPLWSYSNRTYTKATATGAELIPVFGQLISAKINVISAYSGSESPNFNIDAFVLNSAGSVIIWNPQINPKITGERILYPTSHTGTQSGDTISDPGVVYILDDQIYPDFSTAMSDGDATVTLEIMTDQGITSSNITPLRLRLHK